MKTNNNTTMRILAPLAIVGFAFSLIFVPELWAQWETELVDTTGDAGYRCAIAVDAIGQPHISYRADTIAALKYAQWDGSEWQIALVEDTATVYGETSIALDNTGNPHIAFCKYFWYGKQLWHAWWDGADWQQEVVEAIPYEGDVGTYNSIAFDTDGYPHIAYTLLSENTHLKYAYKDAAGWNIQAVDSIPGGTGSFQNVSLAIDSTNQPHISYYDYVVWDLKYANYDGAEWHIERVDTLGQVGKYSSIALDSIGYPHIAYHDHTNYGVKYARWNGSDWQIETVESDIGYGYYTSLALDANDRAHISSAEYMGDLRFAYWDGSDWQIEVVDTDVSCGRTSLAVDDNGYCHIAYYDEIDVYDLKYARRSPTTGIEDQQVDPSEFTLTVSHNPFREAVTITADTDPLPGQLTIYDVSGRLIRSLGNGLGKNTFPWDGKDSSGIEVPTGTYIIRGASEGRLASVRVVKL